MMLRQLFSRCMLHDLPAGTGLAPIRRFSATVGQAKSALPPRPKPPPDDELEESYLKGSGPGGQKINKTNSAVQLKHLPTGIVVKSQATRSRDQNRKIARQVLAAKIDDHLNGPQSRSAIVATKKETKRASSDKKKRRKYRALEQEKAGQDEVGREENERSDESGHEGLKDQDPETETEVQSQIRQVGLELKPNTSAGSIETVDEKTEKRLAKKKMLQEREARRKAKEERANAAKARRQ